MTGVPTAPAARGRRVVVVRPGALTTVQDLGRPGWAHLAVPRAGALDRAAHALANRLVGNDAGAATLETTMDGVGLCFEAPATVAVTGAPAPVLVDRRPRDWGVALYLRAGDMLDVRAPSVGLRSYVAVAGGFDVAPVLGSRSTDLLSGLGPPPLDAGATLCLGEPRGAAAAVDMAPYRTPSPAETLLVHRGPREDWLGPGGDELLYGQTYGVDAVSNRIGLRLEGRPIPHRAGGELPSEGTVWGGIQLLPDGRLVILLADHPTTGGYPVVGVVDDASRSACAQARPGSRLGLRRMP